MVRTIHCQLVCSESSSVGRLLTSALNAVNMSWQGQQPADPLTSVLTTHYVNIQKKNTQKNRHGQCEHLGFCCLSERDVERFYLIWPWQSTLTIHSSLKATFHSESAYSIRKKSRTRLNFIYWEFNGLWKVRRGWRSKSPVRDTPCIQILRLHFQIYLFFQLFQ